jgi:hypothetical protein
MSRERRQHNPGGKKRQRSYSVRGVRRSEVDLPKLARALISMAQAEAEAEAQRTHEAGEKPREEKPRD